MALRSTMFSLDHLFTQALLHYPVKGPYAAHIRCIR